MRFLIREQEFEKPVASGRFHFEQAGEATSEYEAWRLTEIGNEYRFLRVDQDYRATGTNQGVLYHMLLNPSGSPERLKIQVLSMEKPLKADVLFEANLVSVTGEKSGRRFEHELQPSENSVFYFSSAIGLSLILRNAKRDNLISTIFFDMQSAILKTEEDVRIQEYPRKIKEVGHRLVDARPFMIAWPERESLIWLDPFDLPVSLEFENSRTGTDTQFIRYPK